MNSIERETDLLMWVPDLLLVHLHASC